MEEKQLTPEELQQVKNLQDQTQQATLQLGNLEIRKMQLKDAIVKLQQAEFNAEKDGYTATKHQREVGTGYFDEVAQVITGGSSSVSALSGSTEEEQFDKD